MVSTAGWNGNKSKFFFVCNYSACLRLEVFTGSHVLRGNAYLTCCVKWNRLELKWRSGTKSRYCCYRANLIHLIVSHKFRMTTTFMLNSYLRFFKKSEAPPSSVKTFWSAFSCPTNDVQKSDDVIATDFELYERHDYFSFSTKVPTQKFLDQESSFIRV